MGIRQYKPTTPGRRGATVSDFAELTPGAKPAEEAARAQDARPAGETTRARSPSGTRGGGHKRQYRLIDFRRNKDGVPAMVHSIQYDPNRTARIALLALRRRRETIHPGPGRPEAGRPGRERPGRAADGRATACRLAKIPLGRHSQHRAAAGPRRRALPLCRHQGHPGRPRRRLGADQPAQRRNPPRAGRLPGDDRRDRQRATTWASCWARRAASDGWDAGRTSAARR